MTASFSFIILLWVLLFVLGICIFSFLNVIIYCAPRKMQFWKGHSVCPACGRKLRAKDLIPVVSYLILGGKCRYCGAKIGIRDTLVELMGGILALLCAWNWRQAPVTALLVFVFFCILTVVAFIDMDTMEIPDGCHIAITILAMVSFLLFLIFPDGAFAGIAAGVFPVVSIASRLIGMACVSLPMLLLALIISGAFGGGDIKLMAACGLFLGWRLTLVSTILAFAAGGLWGIFLILKKKKERKDHFAFGPFLCVGMVCAIFFGENLIR